MLELKLSNAQIRIQKGQVQPDNRISWNSSERANEPRASIWAMNATLPMTDRTGDESARSNGIEVINENAHGSS